MVIKAIAVEMPYRRMLASVGQRVKVMHRAGFQDGRYTCYGRNQIVYTDGREWRRIDVEHSYEPLAGGPYEEKVSDGGVVVRETSGAVQAARMGWKQC